MKWVVSIILVAMMTLQASGAATLFCSALGQVRDRATSDTSCHGAETGKATEQPGQNCSLACAAACGVQISGLPEVQFLVADKIVTRSTSINFAAPGFEPTVDPPVPKIGFDIAHT
jgi:hypothetical protein